VLLSAFAAGHVAHATNYVVNLLSDATVGATACSAVGTGSCDLRDAIEQANRHTGLDTVSFISGLSGTITLTHGEISVTDDLDLSGPGTADLVLSGNHASRILNIFVASPGDPALTVSVSGMQMVNATSTSDGGAIVFISSIAALKAGSQMAVYDSSKAALGGLMRNIAHLGSRRGIRANLVYPGLVDTPNGREAGASRPNRGKGHVPFGRQATAWEIAYAVLFFLSDESVYVTAQTLAVDSGLSGM
jgi:NAD(P)-dependent dehydrogenase (short-subunit alcohol dehydrogenase family)